MATFKTDAGRKVSHCHVRLNPTSPCSKREWTNAEKQEKREELAELFPNVTEVLEPSRKYNCFGYAYTEAHGWFEEPDLFIADDFSEVSMDEAKTGDVLVYEDDDGVIAHSALVKKVKSGEIKKVRSKWGKMAAVVHDPTEVPEDYYGQPVRLLRRNA